MITNLSDGFIWATNTYLTNIKIRDIAIYTNQISSNEMANIYAYMTRPEHWWQTPIPAYWIPIATAATAFIIWLGIVLKRNSWTNK